MINSLSLVVVSVPINVLMIQKESNDIINFQPIPKDIIAELILGTPEEDFPKSLEIKPPPSEDISKDNVRFLSTKT